jgi:hypothetical protein
MISLNLLNLTTPEPKFPGSNVSIIYPPGSFPQNAFFSVLPNGDLKLWAPTKGVSSKSTSRTRTELRECNEQGIVYNWRYPTFNHHWLQAAMTVLQVPKKGETVIGQIHVHGNTRPPVKLSFDKAADGVGQLTVGFREEFDQPNPVDFVLLDGIPLGTRFTYNIHVTSRGAVLFSAGFTDVNGERRTGNLTLQFKDSWAKQSLYFKAGVYNQEDPTDTTLDTEGSAALIHKLEISHEV